MKFDVVVGNPPFNSNDTHHSDGKRKQGKNLSKQFFLKSIELASKYSILIASYSVRVYSVKVSEQYRLNGLYKIVNSQHHFDGILGNIATFFFDHTKVVDVVEDEMAPKEEVPQHNLSDICFPRATHNGLARAEYEHLLTETGNVKVIVTTGIQKYTSDYNLVDRMGDRTRGKWRVVFNKVNGGTDGRGNIGKLVIATPDDLLTQNIGCFVVDSEEDAITLKAYLETPEVDEKIRSHKVSAANSKNAFKYIKNPLV